MKDVQTQPDDVFEALMARSVRNQKRENLKLLHELCKVQHNGSRDFSLSNIGKLWALAGGISARALYNAPSEDYRTLIQTWEKFSGPVQLKKNRSAGGKYQFLDRIEDPAVRALMQGIIIERDKLKAELNMLKSNTWLELDRRPVRDSPAKASVERSSDASAVAFSDSEREALERSVSPALFRDEGWTEGKNGEVFTEKGRRLYEAGYVRAIKKVLGGQGK